LGFPEGFDAEKAEVFDIMWQRVLILGSQIDEIDVKSLKIGLYIIVLKDKSGRFVTARFIKE
jgi:hypothetical protein